MRIIAGDLKGRIFASPGTRKTHPMSDRMRGGLFNVLGDVTGLGVLDAFSGTGALSFEALSRGAERATAIESDKNAQRVIAENAHELGVHNKFKLIRASVASWHTTAPEGQVYDIVMSDPPYHALQLPVNECLSKHVKDGGLLVLSWPGRERIPEFQECKLISQKKYGDGQLLFYIRISKKSSGNSR